MSIIKFIKNCASLNIFAFLLLFQTAKCQTVKLKDAVSLRDLIELAIDKSYVRQNNLNEIKRDRIDRMRLYQGYLPNLGVNTSYTELNEDITFVVPPIQIPPLKLSPQMPPVQMAPISMTPIVLQEKHILKADVTASMVLFSGMKIPWQLDALKYREQANQHLLRRTESDIVKEVSDFYWKLAVIDQMFVLLNQSQERLDSETKFAEAAFAQGLITSYDLSKIDIAKQDIIAKKLELSSNKNLIVSRLYEFTGKSKEELSSIHPEMSLGEVLVLTDTLGIGNRPELMAMQMAVDANRMKYKAGWSGYIPVIYAFGKKELRNKDLSAFDPEWYVGVGLKWNLFDGGQVYRENQKLQLDIESAKNNLNQTESMMRLSLEKSQSEYFLSNQLINVALIKMKISKKGLDIAIGQYRQGLISITERILAEMDYCQASTEYAQLIYRQKVAYLSLLESSGNLTIENIK